MDSIALVLLRVSTALLVAGLTLTLWMAGQLILGN